MPRQLERNGLDSTEASISDKAIEKVVADYTREAGVRSLERELGKVFRKLDVKSRTQLAHRMS